MSHDERLLELISALVDGELTPDEQRRAQQLLADDADLRAHYDQLLDLRGKISSLPRYSLPPEFAQQVLRRAEREMLVAPAAGTRAEGTQAPGNGRPRVPSPAATAPRRGLGFTSWLSLIAALAAVLILVIVVQFANRDDRIADRDGQDPNSLMADGSGSDGQRQGQQHEDSQGPALVDSEPRDRHASEAPEEHLADSSDRSAVDDTADADSNSEQPQTPSTDDRQIAENQPRPTPAPAVPDDDADELDGPMFAYVFEVVLTTRGIQENVFQQSLARTLIDVHSAIPVDRRMESALLSHKYFGSIKPEDLPADSSSTERDPIRNHLELFFVACKGGQFDALTEDLAAQQGFVVKVRHDLASATSDMELYTRMQKLVERDAEGDEWTGVHPLELEAQLRDRLTVALRQSKGITAPMLPLQGNRPAPDAPQQAKMHNIFPPEFEHMVFLALVVLRSEDTVKP